jgi:TatD DNase family protein
VQLELAAECGLPVNIHLREATEDFFAILEDCRHLHLRGNLHAFSGSAETFRRLSRLGDWYVGIGGVVTFKKAGIAQSLADIPMERILLETDSPYLTPVPYRGSRNESAYIPIIAAKIAEIKGLSIEEVARVSTENAKELFAL